ncbi:MAG TPA: metallophosphoesterase [Chitinophagales bacterium]|nr:metallophosphoesterase [Chitinophagales bacterium]
MKHFFYTFICLCLTSFSYAQSLTRGPYLQSATNNSIKVMWRTSVKSPSVVRYGLTPEALNNVITDTASVTNHIIKISGLQPKTTYYYSVGYDNTLLAGANSQHHFTTAPPVGDTSGFKFWVTGDFGGGNNEQIKVRRWFENYIQSNFVENWLWLGDNVYNDGTDAEYSAKVFDNYYGYDSIFRFLPFYPIPGNHDYNSVNRFDDPSQHKGPYFDMVEVFKNGEMGGVPSGTENYYSFDYGNTHFIALNSELWQYIFFDLPNPYKTWLENDIKNSKQTFKVAYWHQPPYSKGSHDSDDGWELFMKGMRERFLPILEKYGIDLVLCGHSHVYERSYLINKHYGVSGAFNRNTMMVDSSSGNPDSNRTYIKYTYGPNKDKGTVYTVVGNSGKSEEDNGRMHPVMHKKFAANKGVGSMILEVKGNTLTGTYYKDNGELFDKFRIIKQDSVSVISGIKNNSLIQDVKIYPNPFKNQLMVEFNAKQSVPTAITIQNLSGQLIVQTVWNGKSNLGFNQVEIDELHQLSAGEYIISIQQGDHISSQKVVKL